MEENSEITVRNALSYATHEWKSLPKWLRDAYEQGNVLFLDKRVEIRVGKRWLKAGINESIVLKRTGAIGVKRCIGVC